jgi:hypothetical protein
MAGKARNKLSGNITTPGCETCTLLTEGVGGFLSALCFLQCFTAIGGELLVLSIGFGVRGT